MATHVAHPRIVSASPIETPADLACAREVLRHASVAIGQLANDLDEQFLHAVNLLFACRGHVVVMGVGKSGHVGQKLSATLASTATPSLFVHAAEAVHGDLGRIRRDDVALILSNSGESLEIVTLLPHLRDMGVPIVAITRQSGSSLGRAAQAVIALGNIAEACPMGLVPTSSTTAMLALGDALAMTLMAKRPNITATYARLHPGGALGHKLRRVDEVMRLGARLPLAPVDASLGQVLHVMGETPGRPGAALLIDGDGRLKGLFTDGDLRRLVERGETQLSRPIREIMRHGPKTVRPEQRISEAIALLAAHHVDQVPVIDAAGRPVGLLDVQDVLPTGA